MRTETEKDAARAVHLAIHLFQMIDHDQWKDAGGDDGQGHYEGLYHAADIEDELSKLSDKYPYRP